MRSLPAADIEKSAYSADCLNKFEMLLLIKMDTLGVLLFFIFTPLLFI